MKRKNKLPLALFACAFLAAVMTACDGNTRSVADSADIADIAMVIRAVSLSQKDSSVWARTLFPGHEHDCGSIVNNINSGGVCGGDGDPMKKGSLRGIVYNTIVNRDSVDVWSGPAYDSVLFQVHTNTRVQIIGISKENSLGANGEHWVKVRIKVSERPDKWSPVLERGHDALPEPGPTGWLPDGDYWIFGRYVNYKSGDKITPVDMRVKLFGDELIGVYEVDGERRSVKLRGHRHKDTGGGPSYSVFYSPHAEDAHYRLVPGSYMWRPDDGVFSHVSYDVQFCHVHGLPGPSMVR